MESEINAKIQKTCLVSFSERESVDKRMQTVYQHEKKTKVEGSRIKQAFNAIFSLITLLESWGKIKWCGQIG